MRMQVRRLAWRLGAEGKDLDPAVVNAARAEDPIGRGLQVIGVAAQDDDLEAQLVIQVHVHRRADLVAEVVLHVGQGVGQIADVVVIDEGERADRLDVRPRLALRDHRARHVAKGLRARRAARLDQAIEVAQERLLHRHAKANQPVLLLRHLHS